MSHWIEQFEYVNQVITVWRIVVRYINGVTLAVWCLSLGSFGRESTFLVTLNTTDYCYCYCMVVFWRQGNLFVSTIVIKLLHSCSIIMCFDTWACWLDTIVSNMRKVILGIAAINLFAGRRWRYYRAMFNSNRERALAAETPVTVIILFRLGGTCFCDFDVSMERCHMNDVKAIRSYGMVNSLWNWCNRSPALQY